MPVILDNVQIPDGYTTTGEYREPAPGEYYLSSSRGKHKAKKNCEVHTIRDKIILKKTPPPWEKLSWMPLSGWLYQESSGVWKITDREPIKSHHTPTGGQSYCDRPCSSTLNARTLARLNGCEWCDRCYPPENKVNLLEASSCSCK